MEHQDENPDMTYVGMQDGQSAQTSYFKQTVENENSNSEPDENLLCLLFN